MLDPRVYLQSKAKACRTPCFIIFQPIWSQSVSSASFTGMLLKNLSFLWHFEWCLNLQVGVATPLPFWCLLLVWMPYKKGKKFGKPIPLPALRWYFLFIANTYECAISRLLLPKVLLIRPVPDLLVAAAGKARLDADEGAFGRLFLSRILRFIWLTDLLVVAAVAKKIKMRMVNMVNTSDWWLVTVE